MPKQCSTRRPSTRNQSILGHALVLWRVLGHVLVLWRVLGHALVLWRVLGHVLVLWRASSVQLRSVVSCCDPG